MTSVNIPFEFADNTHIANVYYSNSPDRFTVYFTDVELILEFGSKAEYSRINGLKLLKTGNGAEVLIEALSRELEMLVPAAA